jgi:hypothetical protein
MTTSTGNHLTVRKPQYKRLRYQAMYVPNIILVRRPDTRDRHGACMSLVIGLCICRFLFWMHQGRSLLQPPPT